MAATNRVTIAGASLAGLSAAYTLRTESYDGEIVIADSSSELPSDRPPLSKKILSGEMEPEAATQPMAAKLDELNVELRLSTSLTALDRASTTISTSSDGIVQQVASDAVIIATGAEPVTFGLNDRLSGVHTLRTLQDGVSLRDDLAAAQSSGSERIVVVGAGFIGAEVAATTRGMGFEVTLVEAGPTPMARVFEPEIGTWVGRLHTSRGVDVRYNAMVASIDSADGKAVTGITLADGSQIESDLVVLGLGVAPSVGWLESSGLDLSDGVICDSALRCAPGIFAAGDVASWNNLLFNERMRVEHWDLAIAAGAAAARSVMAEMAGEDPPDFSPVPWFWSDQYDVKIQMAGRCNATDEVVIIDRDDENNRLVAAFRRDDRCVAVFGANRPRHVVMAKMAMEQSLDWDTVLDKIP